MKENISNMKKHSCPSCGGQLRVDTGRQMYECPFCGLTYDYEYFREDDVLERASRAIEAGEFRSAKEAYEFMLQKDPHNFEALRGLILASAEAKDMDELRKAERHSKIKSEKIEGCITRANTDCLPEHKEYFEKMQALFETGKEYREEIVAISKLRTDRKRHYSHIDRLEREKEEHYIGARESLDGEETVPIPPKAVIILSLALYLVWTLILISLIWGGGSSSSSTSKTSKKTTTRKSYSTSSTVQKEKETKQSLRTVLVVSSAIEAGIVFFAVQKQKKINEVEEQIRSVSDETDDMSREVNAREEKLRELNKKIHMISNDLRKLDPLGSSGNGSGNSNGSGGGGGASFPRVTTPKRT